MPPVNTRRTLRKISQNEILISFAEDHMRAEFLPWAREFVRMGFTFVATPGTAEYFNKNGVSTWRCTPCRSLIGFVPCRTRLMYMLGLPPLNTTRYCAFVLAHKRAHWDINSFCSGSHAEYGVCSAQHAHRRSVLMVHAGSMLFSLFGT